MPCLDEWCDHVDLVHDPFLNTYRLISNRACVKQSESNTITWSIMVDAFDNRKTFAVMGVKQLIVIVDMTISDDGRNYTDGRVQKTILSVWLVNNCACIYLHDSHACVVLVTSRTPGRRSHVGQRRLTLTAGSPSRASWRHAWPSTMSEIYRKRRQNTQNSKNTWYPSTERDWWSQ